MKLMLWEVFTLGIFLPGWLFISVIGAQDCSDERPWRKPAQDVWFVLSALMALGVVLIAVFGS